MNKVLAVYFHWFDVLLYKNLQTGYSKQYQTETENGLPWYKLRFE